MIKQQIEIFVLCTYFFFYSHWPLPKSNRLLTLDKPEINANDSEEHFTGDRWTEKRAVSKRVKTPERCKAIIVIQQFER